jgi:hypothetical protein
MAKYLIRIQHTSKYLEPLKFFFVYFLGGLECVGHSFAYVAHF